MSLKKIICFAVSIALTLNLCVFGFSSDKIEPNYQQLNIEEEIERAEKGITDVPLSQEQLDNISAYILKEDGTKVPVEVNATIRCLNTTRDGAGQQYVLTAVARTYSQGEQSPNNSDIDVVAYGTLSWTDNLGPINTLNYVSGSWVCGSDSSVSGDRMVAYGTRSTGGYGDTVTKYPTANKFSYNGIDINGTQFFLKTYADVENDNGDTEYLTLQIFT